MGDTVWRPLSVQTEEQTADYDALHEGVPEWMQSSLWDWIKGCIYLELRDSVGYRSGCNIDLAESLSRTLRIPMVSLASQGYAHAQAQAAIHAFRESGRPLDIVDYLISHCEYADLSALDRLLAECGSAWKVGERDGFKGLERRVPEGVQVAADHAMQECGRSGRRLAHAWELLYGVRPDPTGAYAEAVKAVEAVACPLLCPSDKEPSLGKAINVVRTQHWRVPMSKEHEYAVTEDVLLGMLRILWNGQHDRHDDGEPSAPGNVSLEEATVAVGLAVTLVHWFAADLVVRA